MTQNHSATQHDSAKDAPLAVTILAKPCEYCGFHKQASAKIDAIQGHCASIVHQQEQCRIYALFTNDALSKM
jgi:hypothetical protein